MATMIEKMARAMAAADSGPEGSGLFNIHWAEFGEGYKSSARAALEALLGPSETMVESGDSEVNDRYCQLAKRAYQSMIQAALEEK